MSEIPSEGAGKGDATRPFSGEAFRAGHDRIKWPSKAKSEESCSHGVSLKVPCHDCDDHPIPTENDDE